MIYEGIEAGGTKFSCAVGTGPHDFRAERRLPTTMAEETIRSVIEFFRGQDSLESVGIGSFGPVDLQFDRITTTPKPGWANTDLAGAIHFAFNVPVKFDADVNVAALMLSTGGSRSVGLVDFIYLTVGTGIGWWGNGEWGTDSRFVASKDGTHSFPARSIDRSVR